MKARVKATGEIVDIAEYSTIYAENYAPCFYPSELEFLENSEDYWERLKHQYAGMAMQGLCANAKFMQDHEGDFQCNEDMIAAYAKDIAHALVEKYKKEEK